jgi:hypothetical protein
LVAANLSATSILRLPIHIDRFPQKTPCNFQKNLKQNSNVTKKVKSPGFPWLYNYILPSAAKDGVLLLTTDDKMVRYRDFEKRASLFDPFGDLHV